MVARGRLHGSHRTGTVLAREHLGETPEMFPSDGVPKGGGVGGTSKSCWKDVVRVHALLVLPRGASAVPSC